MTFVSHLTELDWHRQPAMAGTRLWDLRTQREVCKFRGAKVEFSPDGTMMAIGSSGGADLHADVVLDAEGNVVGFKEGSAMLSMRILRAPL